MEQVLSETLACHENPAVRRIFVSLTDRLILLIRSRFQQHHPPHLMAQLHTLLNQHFDLLCTHRESDLGILLDMYNILLNFLCRLELPRPSPTGSSLEGDTLSELVLQGLATVPAYLLMPCQLSVLQHLLLAITYQQQQLAKAEASHEHMHSTTLDHVRRVLLILILEHAYRSEESFRALKLSFLRPLLADPCPAIALHASTFIMHRLRQCGHRTYQNYFSKVLAWAQRENNADVLNNPYFQCCIIMEHITEFPE
eukprot:NODE_2280_length_952_cov_90.064230_g1878_i0.p1 GENE.NODE_2280_length_952_cov_90.064230_g1878_i0~~NODE_2280_length_952_cov_90.064230_g1878_i0.p1  ORF type:complete len:298 (-),score=86.77 NODE_2280_length_952_cov_90.064230_g1878_i0:58-822(-)